MAGEYPHSAFSEEEVPWCDFMSGLASTGEIRKGRDRGRRITAGFTSQDTSILRCRRRDDRVSGPDVRVLPPDRIVSGSHVPRESHSAGAVRAPHPVRQEHQHQVPRQSRIRRPSGSEAEGGSEGLRGVFVPCTSSMCTSPACVTSISAPLPSLPHKSAGPPHPLELLSPLTSPASRVSALQE